MTTPSRKARRAAIAALVAVTTGLTAVTPAVAAEAPKAPAANSVNSSAHPDATQAAGLNTADGSKLPEGKNTSEDHLKAHTDATAKWLKDNFDNAGVSPADVFADYQSPKALVDNEKGALDALRAHFADVTDQLEKAAQNQADAQASVKYALAVDAAADQAWKDAVAAIAKINKTHLNALVKDVNDVNKTAVSDIPYLSVSPTPAEALTFIRSIVAHRDNSWDIEADHDGDNFVRRDYAIALDKLLNDEDTQSFLKPFLDAQPKLFAAQQSDVITRQMFMDRARAQVQVLRLIQADYAIRVRMIELYENGTLQRNKVNSVKDAYFDVLEGVGGQSMAEAIVRELGQLKQADANATALFLDWSNDLKHSDPKNNDEVEANAYKAYRDSQARQTYNNIFKDSVWQNELEKAQNIDRDAFASLAEQDAAKKQQADAKEAASKANAAVNKLQEDLKKSTAANEATRAKAKLATEDLKRIKEQLAKEKQAEVAAAKATKAEIEAAKAKADKSEADLAAASKKLAELQAEVAGMKNSQKGQTHKEPKNESPESGSADGNVGKIGIVAAILALLGALAAAFPMIQKMMPPRV